MISGDIHGSNPHVEDLCRWSKKFDCDAIVQVGDWAGVWPFRKNGWKSDARGVKIPSYERVLPDYWLNKMENVLSQHDVHMYFLDGNHEWFCGWDQLGIDINADDFVWADDHITYLPRGFAWEWDGVRFLSVGGAVSVDRYDRQEGLTWDTRERLTDAQVKKAVSRGKVDVMLSHDTVEIPSQLAIHLRTTGYSNPKLDAISRQHREKLSHIARKVRPQFLFHGHYHYSYVESWEGIRVRGIDRDGSGNKSFHVFDTEDFRNGDQR